MYCSVVSDIEALNEKNKELSQVSFKVSMLSHQDRSCKSVF